MKLSVCFVDNQNIKNVGDIKKKKKLKHKWDQQKKSHEYHGITNFFLVKYVDHRLHTLTPSKMVIVRET